MTTWPGVFAAGLVLVLAGCGASPPVRFYSLQALELVHEPDPDGAAVMSLGPLSLPDYLARTQFVTRGDGAEVIVDDYHRWAEPLDDAITRIVAVNVDNLVDGLIVVAFRSSNLVESDYRAQASIVRFDADQDGRAFLVVQWGIATPDGDVVVPARRSEYQAQASRSGDPGAIAIALNDTIAQLSREIATAIDAELE